MRYSEIIAPFWVREIRRRIPSRPVILDFGCGNESAEATKRWFPFSIYHGADITHTSNSDKADVFYQVDTNDELHSIPNCAFDVVLFKHVIEHLLAPLTTLRVLTQKLRPGGFIFISFPHPRSITFPSAEGTLNFYDDPSHVWLPSIGDVVKTLTESNVAVIKQGATRSPDKVLLGIPFFALNFARKVAGRRLRAKGLWDLYGFEYHVIGQAKPAIVEDLSVESK